MRGTHIESALYTGVADYVRVAARPVCVLLVKMILTAVGTHNRRWFSSPRIVDLEQLWLTVAAESSPARLRHLIITLEIGDRGKASSGVCSLSIRPR